MRTPALRGQSKNLRKIRRFASIALWRARRTLDGNRPQWPGQVQHSSGRFMESLCPDSRPVQLRLWQPPESSIRQPRFSLSAHLRRRCEIESQRAPASLDQQPHCRGNHPHKSVHAILTCRCCCVAGKNTMPLSFRINFKFPPLSFSNSEPMTFIVQ